jgi:hypothetical protein
MDLTDSHHVPGWDLGPITTPVTIDAGTGEHVRTTTTAHRQL